MLNPSQMVRLLVSLVLLPIALLPLIVRMTTRTTRHPYLFHPSQGRRFLRSHRRFWA